jgi:hypothetical protein
MAQAGRRPDRTAEFIEPAGELTDAAREPEPEPGDVSANLAGLKIAAVVANAEALRTENETLRAKLAEHAERDAAVWQTLKSAAIDIGMKYRKARDWAARAIAAGRSNEAVKTGRVIVNVTALRAFHELKPPPQ